MVFTVVMVVITAMMVVFTVVVVCYGNSARNLRDSGDVIMMLVL
jgi:p-aminobenzoyl-glutamate transporter AbgT